MSSWPGRSATVRQIISQAQGHSAHGQEGENWEGRRLGGSLTHGGSSAHECFVVLPGVNALRLRGAGVTGIGGPEDLVALYEGEDGERGLLAVQVLQAPAASRWAYMHLMHGDEGSGGPGWLSPWPWCRRTSSRAMSCFASPSASRCQTTRRTRSPTSYCMRCVLRSVVHAVAGGWERIWGRRGSRARTWLPSGRTLERATGGQSATGASSRR